MINPYLINDLERCIPYTKESRIVNVEELSFGMLIIKHADYSYTEYYPNNKYKTWRHYSSAADMYDHWCLSEKNENREAQFLWRLNYIIDTFYTDGKRSLCKELDISEATLSNYTTGKRTPDYNMIIKISATLSEHMIYNTVTVFNFLMSLYADPYIEKELEKVMVYKKYI